MGVSDATKTGVSVGLLVGASVGVLEGRLGSGVLVDVTMGGITIGGVGEE